MRLILLAVFCAALQMALANPGDTTWVRAHDKVDMVWYERYKAWAEFPAAGNSYHRINLHFTIGCATNGCSDWDYTVIMNMYRPTGTYDSTVSSIDTISTNPLVVDTTWNVFEVKERLEIARMITPYGGYMRTGQAGYNNQWEHTLVYDLTDFQMLFVDSVEFEVLYQGWSSGFSATLDFEMIEGVPARRVHKITRPWSSDGGAYTNPSNFNNNLFGAKNITLDNATLFSWLRITPTGHGFVNNQNCAEFCQRNYFVHVNNSQIAQVNMWRNDCGLNPIYPQGGTWLYDRANWCPGGKAWWYDHFLTPHHTGNSLSLNFSIQNYTVTVPPGETPPTYIIGNLLFEADSLPHVNDAELMEIISPSDFSDNKRHNPVCGQAMVKIRNKGTAPLTSCDIKYRMAGGNWKTYAWTGSLDFFEEEVVTLPYADLWQWQSVSGKATFEAMVENPNGNADEYALNDRAVSKFDAVPEFPRDIYLWLRTNNVGSDTWWTITRLDDGVVVSQGDNLSGNTVYYDTLSLGAGCYELLVGDRSKNGLSWWANNDGNGFVRLRGHSGTTFQRVFGADFGTVLRNYFVVKTGIGIEEQKLDELVFVYPNPNNGHFKIEADGQKSQKWEIKITDVSGRAIWSKTSESTMYLREDVDLSHVAKGVYFVQIGNGQSHLTKKIIIE